MPRVKSPVTRSCGALCIVMRHRPLLRNIRNCRIGRAPDQAGQASGSRAVVHSIDGLVARRRPSVQPHRTGIAVGIGLRRWDDITLGDGEGQGERAPSRRYGWLRHVGRRPSRAPRRFDLRVEWLAWGTWRPPRCWPAGLPKPESVEHLDVAWWVPPALAWGFRAR